MSLFGHTHQKKHQKGSGGSKKKCIRELEFAKEGETYAIVSKANGDCRFEVTDFDGRVYKATLPRSFKKGVTKEIVKVGDTIKIQEGISKDQYFINHLFAPDEVEKLISYGEIKNTSINTELDINCDLNFSGGEITLDDIADI